MQSGYSQLNDSKNEFMGTNQNDLNPQQFRKFYGMMMQFMQNPSLMNSMMQDSRMNSQTEENKMENHRNSKNIEENQSIHYKAQGKVIQPMKKRHQKGGDVLKAYLPAEDTEQAISNKSKNYGSPVVPKIQNLNMEDSVISTFQNNQSLLQQKNQQLKSKNTFDDVPIQSTYISQMVGRVNNTSRTINSPRSGKQDFDERPITGGTKNFEEMLNQQLAKQGLPPQFISKQLSKPIKVNTFEHKIENKYNYGNIMVQQQNEDIQNPSSQQGNKKFLKKGTRQFLSSAKYSNKSKNKNKNPDQTLKEQTDNSRIKVGDRDITPKNTRAKSQNRVLNNRKKPDTSVNKVERKQFADNLNDSIVSNQQNQSKLQLSRKIAPTPPKQKTIPTTTRVVEKNISQSQRATPPQNKKVINVFQGDSSSDSQDEPGVKHSNYITKKTQEWQQKQPKKSQIIKGVYLTEEQIQQLLKKCSPQIKIQQQKLSILRQKYQELCKINQDQRNQMKQDLANEKEQFELYKQSQIQKLKNQKRIIERQNKNSNSSVHNKDYKEENQNLKKELEKEREENKKREKNNKIIIEKWKKQAEELKSKLINTQMELQKLKQNPPTNMQASNKSSARPSTQQSKHKKQIQKIQTAAPKIDYEEQPIKNKSTLPQYEKIKSTSNQNPYQKYNYLDQDLNKNKNMGQIKAKKFQDQELFGNHRKIQEMEYSESNQDQNQEDNSPMTNYYSNDIQLTSFVAQPPEIQRLTQTNIDNLFRYQHNPQYLAYLHKKQSPSRKLMHTSQNSLDGRTTNIYNDGSKQVLFTTGVKKQYFDNGYTIIHFKNGDIKQKLTDNTIIYFFNEKGVDQITFPNKVNIYRFQNNQLEIHFGDDRVHIRHPDGTLKMIGQ